MFDIAAALRERQEAGIRVAVATVVAVEGSAPRAVGASMALDEKGLVIGSISGGCVEGAAADACRAVLDGGTPRLERFGITDEEAFSVGLTCGGVIEVFVSALGADAATRRQLAASASGVPAVLATVVAGPRALVGLHFDDENDDAVSDALSAAGITAVGAGRLHAAVAAGRQGGRSRRLELECDGIRLEIFLESELPHPRMLVFGATDFAAALSDAGSLLGYRVTVCDPREAFATSARFPSAAEVVVAWPDEYLAQTAVDSRTAVCVLSHDERFDLALIEIALRLPVGYVGAMGSRRTHASRLAALRERGLDDLDLGRLHAPIGLDIGASSPAETAVSILAEIIAARTGRHGGPLREGVGPIHRAAPTLAVSSPR